MEKLLENSVEKQQQITFGQIIKISYPLILSMFSMNIMIFIDRAFISKYSLTQFSATMPSSSFATTIASIFVGIITFTSALISQYYGAQKHKECSSCMWQGVYLSILFSILLLIVSPFTSYGFNIMGHTGELLKYEKQFFYFIILSSCMQLFSTAFSSFYSGISDTKTTMIVGILTNIFNILFDWVFIFGNLGFPEMGGIVGAGTATLVSNIICVVIYIVLLNRKALKSKFEVFTSCKFDRDLIHKLLKFGFPSGIQTLVGTGYFSLLLLFIGGMGEVDLSSANIAFTIEGVSIFPVFGLAAAVSIIAGQERGAGRVENIPAVIRKGIVLGLCFNVIIMIVFNFFPEWLISIFNSGKEEDKFLLIKDTTITLIRITSVWLIFDTIQIIIGRVLRAVGDTVFMMITYSTVPILFYAVLPYIICVVAKLPLFWLWVELATFTGVMLIIVTIRFLSGKWKKISVI